MFCEYRELVLLLTLLQEYFTWDSDPLWYVEEAFCAYFCFVTQACTQGLRCNKMSAFYCFIRGILKGNWQLGAWWWRTVTSTPAWRCWVGSCWGPSLFPSVPSLPAMQTSPRCKGQLIFVLLWKYFWTCKAPKGVSGFPWGPWTLVGVKTLCRAARGVSPGFFVYPLNDSYTIRRLCIVLNFPAYPLYLIWWLICHQRDIWCLGKLLINTVTWKM